ncbi:MAG: SRPBCC family protein, partial [Candidatus Sericytochromatia bacterium]|nr:SRPBCC family protein [Candidatus Sericytochromatia bacterium]
LASLLGLCALAPAAWSTPTPSRPTWAAERGGEVTLRDLPVDSGAAVEARLFVRAPWSVCRAVLWDHQKFPEFMPHSRSSRSLKEARDFQVVEQTGAQGPFLTTLITERRLEPTRISWHGVGGDLLRNDGEWEFTHLGDGTGVRYRVHVVPHQPVPASVTRFLQRQALPTMLLAVRRRIETSHADSSPRPGSTGPSRRP